jgi:hypothetical protein
MRSFRSSVAMARDTMPTLGNLEIDHHLIFGSVFGRQTAASMQNGKPVAR